MFSNVQPFWRPKILKVRIFTYIQPAAPIENFMELYRKYSKNGMMNTQIFGLNVLYVGKFVYFDRF